MTNLRKVKVLLKSIQCSLGISDEEFAELLREVLDDTYFSNEERHSKLIGLGINEDTDECICLYSSATFEELKRNPDKYELSCSATDWGGRDALQRTLELCNVHLTGEEFQRFATVVGADDDMGHVYPWAFSYTKIAKVEAN